MRNGQRKMDYAYDQLKEGFLSGEFKFGQRLVVNQLAESLGTSRQPVLDAIKRLQEEDLVEVTAQVGSHVVIPSPHAIEDFFEVFATLEGLAARLAATRHRPEQMIELELTAGLIRQAVDGDRFDLRRYQAGNRRFHEAIHLLAASREAARAAERFWDRSDFLISSMGMTEMHQTLDRAASEHERIVAAIRKRDDAKAEALAVKHIRGFAHPVRRGLDAAIAQLGHGSSGSDHRSRVASNQLPPGVGRGSREPATPRVT